jgi:hypothetical protein
LSYCLPSKEDDEWDEEKDLAILMMMEMETSGQKMEVRVSAER